MSSCLKIQTLSFLAGLVKVIELQFSSLHRAFEKQENFSELTNLFSRSFQKVVLPCSHDWNLKVNEASFVEPFYHSMPTYLRKAIVDTQAKFAVDECLSSFEAGDFGSMSEIHYGCKRIFNTLGSLFYYKDYLICSHLPRSTSTPINLLLYYNNLLNHSNTQQLTQQHFWKEINLTTSSHSKMKYRCINEYRTFVLALSSHNSLIVTVLEADEESSKLIGSNPSPDLFILSQLQFALSQLVYSGVLEVIEHSLTSGARPSLASLDWFMRKEKGVVEKGVVGMGSKIKNFFRRRKKTLYEDEAELSPYTASQENVRDNAHASFRRRMSDSTLYLRSQLGGGEGSAEGDKNLQQVDDLFNQCHDPSYTHSHLLKNNTASSEKDDIANQLSKKHLHSVSDIEQHHGHQNHPLSPFPLVKLNTGCSNTLFNYAYIDHTNHLIVAPSLQQVATATSLAHYEALQNFHKCSLAIHAIFSKYSNTDLSDVYEYGVLFNCRGLDFKNSDTKSSNLLSSYWVVGRLVRVDSRVVEFYACFHDSAQQHMVDMAFKLIQGSYLL